MADKENVDLFMKFEIDANKHLYGGESSTDFSKSRGGFADDFEKNITFEIKSFTMKMGLVDDEPDSKNTAKVTKEHGEKIDEIQKALKTGDMKAAQALMGKKKSSWGNYYSGQTSKFPTDMKPIRFKRAIDRSSASMLQYCIWRKVLYGATLIKRRSAGGDVSGEVFLRFDFSKVLITNIEWDDDEPINEDVEFVCRSLTINYLPQLPDGSLGAPIRIDWPPSNGGR